MKLLKWIWQLPQNVIGFLMSLSYKAKETVTTLDCSKTTVYYTDNVFGCGVSLGDYILLDYSGYYQSKYKDMAINHEHGHQKQSLQFGWLYLPVVGLVSLVRNIVDRLFHKGWTLKDRYVWYYSGFPEKQADKLGGVER